MATGNYFLRSGNGHQYANRRTAMGLLNCILPEARSIAENVVEFPPYGTCHFASYTDPNGAMISTPNREDNEYGQMDWHSRDHLMLFRDVGDGRGIIYVTKIKPLFGLRTIGSHGVKWGDILRTSVFKKVFRFADLKAAAGC